MKETKEERDLKKKEFTSHKRSGFNDPSLQYYIAMEP